MGKRIDLTGQRFGRLVVEGFAYADKNRHSVWNCRCDCGKSKVVTGNCLTSGHTKSCGCLYEEVNVKHRKRGTRLYRIWRGMADRTENINSERYCDYGGRGIKMCSEWKNDFQKFYDWAMSHGYEEHLTIDRIDNDKGYCPDNCRWTDRKTQNNNRRFNIKIRYEGEEHTLAQWSEKLGIAEGTLWSRLYIHGWPVEEAFRISVGERGFKQITYKGETKTMTQWSKELGIRLGTLSYRISTLGWPVEKAFETPVDERKSHKKK